jgi:hypothetical protein
MKSRIAYLCLAAALTIFPAGAQSRNAAAQRIAGNWLVSITLDGANTPFAVDMATFQADGSLTVISSDRSQSDAIGSYQRTGDREFSSTHTQIVYNEKGTFAAIAKVVASMKLNETADAFSGRYRVDILDAAGKVLAQITGTIGGRLVAPEPL